MRELWRPRHGDGRGVVVFNQSDIQEKVFSVYSSSIVLLFVRLFRALGVETSTQTFSPCCPLMIDIGAEPTGRGFRMWSRVQMVLYRLSAPSPPAMISVNTHRGPDTSTRMRSPMPGPMRCEYRGNRPDFDWMGAETRPSRLDKNKHVSQA